MKASPARAARRRGASVVLRKTANDTARPQAPRTILKARADQPVRPSARRAPATVMSWTKRPSAWTVPRKCGSDWIQATQRRLAPNAKADRATRRRRPDRRRRGRASGRRRRDRTATRMSSCGLIAAAAPRRAPASSGRAGNTCKPRGSPPPAEARLAGEGRQRHRRRDGDDGEAGPQRPSPLAVRRERGRPGPAPLQAANEAQNGSQAKTCSGRSWADRQNGLTP